MPIRRFKDLCQRGVCPLARVLVRDNAGTEQHDKHALALLERLLEQSFQRSPLVAGEAVSGSRRVTVSIA
jgi:hypothetical protein